MSRLRHALVLALTSLAFAGAHAQRDDSAVQRRKLPTARVINGVHCAATLGTYALFHASGALRSCPLAADTVIAGHAFKARTWITLDELHALRSAWLPVDTRLAGHLCKGTGYKGFAVQFTETGSLELCYLRYDTVIDGVPCLHGSFWTEVRGGSKSAVRFHPDSTLESCQLARDFEAGGVRYSKWTRILRDERGNILSYRRAS